MKFDWEGLAEIWPFVAILSTLVFVGLIFAIRHEIIKKREQKAAGIKKVRLSTTLKLKVVGWTIAGIACVFMFFGGIVGLAIGIANPSQTKYDTKKCSYCNGDGLFSDKSCHLCDGKGYIVTQDSFAAGPVLGVFGIFVGAVGYFVALSQKKLIIEHPPLYLTKQRNLDETVIPSNSIEDVNELELYQSLLDMGVITKEEYEARKKELLGL